MPQVEGERSAQITFLGGFMGYRREDAEQPRSLKEVRALHEKARAVVAQGGGDENTEIGDARMDADLAAEVSKFGTVAGYTKLEPGFWDGDDFCLLPGLLIFEGKTSPDSAWSNHLHDRDRLLIATTESWTTSLYMSKGGMYPSCGTMKGWPREI